MLLYSLIVLLTFYIFVLIKRTKKYKYNTSIDYNYNLEKNYIYERNLENNTLKLIDNSYDTLFLKLEFSLNLSSYFFKPYIEVDGLKHYFEYAAKGVRYLNISHIKQNTIKLRIHHLTLENKKINFYGYNNKIDLDEQIVVLAPHADDAEIAAFGLYKSAKNVTIVTTTIGELGLCNYCDIYDEDKATLKKAQLRMIDALTIGIHGRVDIENSLALGYFSGTLKWMRENPDKDASSLKKVITDINQFRQVSHSNLKLSKNAKPSYKYLLNDLISIIQQLKPKYIITPNPIIDSHIDHKYTSYALFDAIKHTKHPCKILTYTNHLSTSESYPIGNLYSSITLPPVFKEFYFDSIYSFELDKDLELDKFFALEAIHDLRDSLLQISIKRSYKHLEALLKRIIFSKDKSYYKRSVRANELFFVINSENIDKLMDI